MRTVSLLVFVLGITVSPAICQTIVNQPLIEKETPLMYAANIVSATEWTLFSSNTEATADAALPSVLPAALTYVSPITPSASLAVRNLVQPESRGVKSKTMEWKFSLLALAATHSADAMTSWNKRELNPLLSPNSGAFGMQTLVIKCAITAGSIGLQAILLRHHPELAKMFARINFLESGVIGATAIRNSFVPAR